MKKVVLLAVLLSGCVYNVSPPQFAPDHPGNPDAQSAPLPGLSRSLATYDPAAGPDPEAPEMDHEAMGHGSMKGMDDGSMKGMDHGSMDHGSMKGMDHGAMDHGSMKGMKSDSQMAADDRSKKTDPESKKAMEHDSMKGMDHGAHWMAPPEAAARKNPVKADAASISRGKQVFQANCVTCHGASGRGDGLVGKVLDPKPADLTVMAGHHSDGDYAWKIANGRGPMPPWKGVLDDKQIWDVVNFVQSLGGAKKGDAPHDHSKHNQEERSHE
ncbi:MAG: c-type cytochrome [Burkholderiales bacterium]